MVNDLNTTGSNDVIYFLIIRPLRSLTMQMYHKMLKRKRQPHLFSKHIWLGIFFYGALSLMLQFSVNNRHPQPTDRALL